MKYIYCITGYSGSGKDTMYKELQKRFNLPLLPTYSNRPKRSDNENSSTKCIGKEEFQKIIDSNNFIECRSYTVTDGSGKNMNWRYLTPIPDTSKSYYLIASFDQMIGVHDCLPKDKMRLIPIVLDVHDSILLIRTIIRQFGPDYTDLAIKQTYDYTYHCPTLSLRVDECDNAAIELCNRFIRDHKWKSEFDTIPSPLHFKNNSNNEKEVAASQIANYMRSVSWHHSKKFNGYLIDDITDFLDQASKAMQERLILQKTMII